MQHPAYNLAMGTIFCAERPAYLREWIEYHRLVGAEHFFMLCNDKPEHHGEVSDVLGPYVDAGLVTWDLHNTKRQDETRQLEGWLHLLKTWGHLTKWLCLTDADAFLFPSRVMSVPPILQAYDLPHIAALAVYVCTFGSNHLLTPPELQIEGFTRRARIEDKSNWTANYILRPDRLDRSIVANGYAFPSAGLMIVDENFVTPGKGKRPGPQKILRLNHYSVRSEEDWRRKVQRGWMTVWDPARQPLAEHKRRMLDRNEVEDTSMSKFVPVLRQAMGLS